MKSAFITVCSSVFVMLTAARLASTGYAVFASMRNLKKKERLMTEVRNRGAKVEI